MNPSMERHNGQMDDKRPISDTTPIDGFRRRTVRVRVRRGAKLPGRGCT